MTPRSFVLEAWGDLACFTRPELKIERFSYPVPTPSAVRGIFDAIYWKKKRNFYWQIETIEILKPPRYIALRRNEVKDRVSTGAVAKWMKGSEEPVPIIADGDKDSLGTDQKGRTQRQTMALKDVAYRVHAHMVPRDGADEALRELEPQFERRARAGQCIYQPYFGCREFAAYFRLVEPDESPTLPMDLNLDVGLMLYDVFDLSRPGSPDSSPSISLFRARVRNGVLSVPEYSSPEVLRAAMEVM